MVSIQDERLTIDHETGLIKTILSNGWTVRQCFDWYVDYDGVHVAYNPDLLEVIGAEQVDEYNAEERAALAECEWDVSELEAEILKSEEFHEAEKEFKARLDKYSYYGVSEKDFY